MKLFIFQLILMLVFGIANLFLVAYVLHTFSVTVNAPWYNAPVGISTILLSVLFWGSISYYFLNGRKF